MKLNQNIETKIFKGTRWLICCGKYKGLEKYAVSELNKLVQKNVSYIVRVNNDKISLLELKKYNVILIGTNRTNRYIKKLSSKGIIKFNEKKEGYSIKITKSPFNPEKQIIILAGNDNNGTLYAVRDFEHYYYDPLYFKYNNNYNQDKPGCRFKPFIDNMPEYEKRSYPLVENRGLWTWGHVVYDYRKYLDNMSKWKMNTVMIWNDFAPINAKEITEYAHSRGIKVIWGYSWCWGEKVDLANLDKELDKWTERVIHTYEEEYLPLGADGIYFEIFTETNSMQIGQKSIAKLAVDWVNHISHALLEIYPDLWLVFGLHTNSIKENYKIMADIDHRVNITWANVGSFPYDYNPDRIDNIAETLDYTAKIACLRGKNEDFGITVKGMTNLDWTSFEKQKGQFIMGEADRRIISAKFKEKLSRWKFVEKHWRKNLFCLLNCLKTILKANPKRITITGLVEDGAWEEKMWLPVVLFAEAMWNPNVSQNQLIERVSLCKDTYSLL